MENNNNSNNLNKWLKSTTTLAILRSSRKFTLFISRLFFQGLRFQECKKNIKITKQKKKNKFLKKKTKKRNNRQIGLSHGWYNLQNDVINQIYTLNKGKRRVEVVCIFFVIFFFFFKFS